VRFPRSSGVLLHPTSLPGRYGIGDLGPEARAFVDFLAEAGQSLWQVLPLGPTGYGDSPYQCFSAFAGNPLLVDLEALVADGLLHASDLESAPAFPGAHVDFGAVIPWKRSLLERAAARFRTQGSPAMQAEFQAWCERNATWLEDFALFMALKDAHGGACWAEWPEALRGRDPAALTAARGRLADGTHAHRFAHWMFFRQWAALRAYAHGKGVAIMGDAPIFVAYDSADVWARPELFHLDAAGLPTVVAGVPPDYFSETGQLWGNPLYRWDAIAEDGYGWWIARVRSLLEVVDRVRLDHFIGFTRCWEVPADAPDARTGRFVPGPGDELFLALESALGDLPIIAEDLGVLTPVVEALRDRFAFPGMKILQFAFGGTSESAFLPHAYLPNCVVYTGTHDNDTTAGWWAEASEGERDFLQRYLAREVHDPAWELLRLGTASVADTFVAPAQDLLSLGTDARMNFPGKPAGNWSWRVLAGALDAALAARLRTLTELFGRVPE
jgi:4-alpha-glucanotransferase